MRRRRARSGSSRRPIKQRSRSGDGQRERPWDPNCIILDPSPPETRSTSPEAERAAWLDTHGNIVPRNGYISKVVVSRSAPKASF
ncbi:hypothetical protein PAI11_11860 [Patulibacter medicamentivorans]|uniref:Uncharacterized protein n=1 Tax=Patulibacter medicamentivorans TaxID=1097667 RepID=H0E319_9ACTN|nr:hypothetical protein PAI11_11860 [Patulibacter medicamentivorans]